MRNDPPPASVRSQAGAPYAAQSGFAETTSPTEAVLARLERAGPGALDDNELLGLAGIDADAAGGLREFLDDPDDGLGPCVREERPTDISQYCGADHMKLRYARVCSGFGDCRSDRGSAPWLQEVHDPVRVGSDEVRELAAREGALPLGHQRKTQRSLSPAVSVAVTRSEGCSEVRTGRTERIRATRCPALRRCKHRDAISVEAQHIVPEAISRALDSPNAFRASSSGPFLPLDEAPGVLW